MRMREGLGVDVAAARGHANVHDFSRREPVRMISLAEWSLGSPTIATRPPYSRTVSASGHALGGIVGAFCLHVRMDFANDRANIALGENDDGVDVRESCENLRPLFSGHQRAAFAFERANRIVGVDRHHEASTDLLGGSKVADVPNVQQVEASIGERDAITGGPPGFHLLAQTCAIENLGLGWRRSMWSGGGRRLIDRVQQLLPRDGGRTALHHNDSAGVVR